MEFIGKQLSWNTLLCARCWGEYFTNWRLGRKRPNVKIHWIYFTHFTEWIKIYWYPLHKTLIWIWIWKFVFYVRKPITYFEYSQLEFFLKERDSKIGFKNQSKTYYNMSVLKWNKDQRFVASSVTNMIWLNLNSKYFGKVFVKVFN